MASTKSYLDFILDCLSELEGITFRPMMGEYILYCQGRIFGGIYDDRFLVKPTATAKRLMPKAQYELPYDGGKEMLLADNIEDRAFMKELVEGMYPELPETKKRRK
ncbi:MAG: TfoX/Sxy family protein [Clostridia bacterium]|nr:TfoX/Sxy family protein [Clostridia bacterium]